MSAALPVAGHAGSAGGLALAAVVLADVAGLEEQERGGELGAAPLSADSAAEKKRKKRDL